MPAIPAIAAIATLHLTSASGDLIDLDRSADVDVQAAVAEAQRIADFVRSDLCRQATCRAGEPLHISITLMKHYCLADVALRAWYRCDEAGHPFRDDSDVAPIVAEPRR